MMIRVLIQPRISPTAVHPRWARRRLVGTSSPNTTSAAPNPAAQSLTLCPRKTSGQNPMTRKIPPTTSPNFRSSDTLAASFIAQSSSIQLELLLPVAVADEGRLIALVEHAVLQHEHVDPGPHEAAVRVGRRAHDRLSADVERCVHEHPAAGLRVELLEEPVVAGVRFRVDGL